MADAIHHFGQLFFGAGQPATDFLGDRQAEQRHHAVSFDFNQSLYRAAGLALSQRNVEHEEARKTIVEHEVGEHPGRAISDLRGNHRAAGWREAGGH